MMNQMGGMMNGAGWGMGWFGMILGPVFMVLVFAAAIAFAVLLVRLLARPGPRV